MDYVFLGSSGAVPSVARDTTSLVFKGDRGAILVDCGGSPVQKLRRAGVDPLAVSHVVVTHMHPDHAYGLPALIHNLRQLGRASPLGVLCRPEHVDALRTLLEVFNLLKRSDGFPIEFVTAGGASGDLRLVHGSLAFSTGANDHGRMPNLALRVDVVAIGASSPWPRAVVYSSDTAPCESVAELAKGADTLIHEATFPDRDRGRFGAHSTASDAGAIAQKAGVRRLILAHIEAEYHDELEGMVSEARQSFGGIVEVAREFEPYPL